MNASKLNPDVSTLFRTRITGNGLSELPASTRDKEMIVATGIFPPAEKIFFEHRRYGLMEPVN
jgi:hypothetical protein